MTVNYKNIRKREIHIIVHVNVCRKSVFDIYFAAFGADLTTVLPVFFSSIVVNTVIVTAGNFEP